MTKPNCENLATVNLSQQGFRTYLPRYQYFKPDHTVQVKPLFPRYLFCFIDTSWYCINGTYGVSYVLMADDGPAHMPEAELDKIRNSENSKGFVVLPGIAGFTGERFEKGQNVKTTEGPLQGLPLTYAGLTGKQRVKVLLSLLGREISATIDERCLQAA